MLLPYYIYFELLSFALAIYFFKGLNKFRLGYFIPLLFIICTADVAGDKLAELKISNYYVYNSYLLLSTPLFFCVFYNMLDYKGWLNKLYIIVCSLIMTFILLNLIYIQGLYQFNTYSLIVIEFVICLLSLMLIIKLFNDDDFNVMLQNHPYFWIGGATLIFSISTLVILGLQQFIQSHNLQIDGKSIYRILIPIFNVILYGSYCYAFYLCNKVTSRSLQP